MLHERAVFAGARLAFIRVAQNVFRFGYVLGDEAPLHAGREARAPTPAQIRLFYFVDDLLRSHLFKGLFKGLVAIVLFVDTDTARIFDAETAADYRNFALMPLVNRAARGWGRLGL